MEDLTIFPVSKYKDRKKLTIKIMPCNWKSTKGLTYSLYRNDIRYLHATNVHKLFRTLEVYYFDSQFLKLNRILNMYGIKPEINSDETLYIF